MRACLAVWLRLLFKYLFVLKYMPMMFFYFLKIIFDISTSKRSKKYKPHSILAKKNLKFDKIQLQTQQTPPKRMLFSVSSMEWLKHALVRDYLNKLFNGGN